MRIRGAAWLSMLALVMIVFVSTASMPWFARSSLGVLLAIGIVVGTWILHLAPVISPPKSKPITHQYILESIPPSHYVEKVRWCLDLAGASYVEVRHISIINQARLPGKQRGSDAIPVCLAAIHR